jgi:histone H2A
MATPSKKSAGAKKAKSAKGSSTSAKAGLIFPVGRVGSLLRKGRYAKRVSASASTYLTAVLEYLTAELLELSAKAVPAKTKRVTPRAITVAVRHDDDLGSLLKDVTLSRGGIVSNVHAALKKKSKAGKKSSATPKL